MSLSSHKQKQLYEHTVRWIFFSLIIIALLASIIVYVQKHRASPELNAVCGIVPGSSCNTVQQSKYAQTFGVDNSTAGIIGFSAMLLSFVAWIRFRHRLFANILFTGGIISGVLALWFIYVQTFILHAFCTYCLIVDVAAIILGMLSIYTLTATINRRKPLHTHR